MIKAPISNPIPLNGGGARVDLDFDWAAFMLKVGLGTDTIINGGDIITNHIIGKDQNGVQRIEVDVDDGRGFIIGSELDFAWMSGNPPDAEYMANGAKTISANGSGQIGLTGLSRTSASPNTGGNVSAGIIGFAWNDDEDFSKASWGGYFESSRLEDAGTSMGIEVDAVNFGSTFRDEDPYNLNSKASRALSCASGGEHGTTTDTATGISFTKNGSRFGRGILFSQDAIRDRSGTLGNYGNMIAISMAAQHTLEWVNDDGTQFAFIDAQYDETISGESMGMSFGANSFQFVDVTSEKLALKISKPASSVNYLDLFSNVTGSNVIVAAEGDDSDIGITLLTKGTGVVKFGTHTADGGTPATTGYITIKDAGGNTRKLAVIT